MDAKDFAPQNITKLYEHACFMYVKSFSFDKDDKSYSKTDGFTRLRTHHMILKNDNSKCFLMNKEMFNELYDIIE